MSIEFALLVNRSVGYFQHQQLYRSSKIPVRD
jgi:hypothetical protein